MVFAVTVLSRVWLLIHVAVALPGAMPWIGPTPTPMSLMATAGMSPRPTEAPSLNGIQELRRRQNGQYLYPPPANWCGFVDSLYDEPLSCSTELTCVNSGTALGCCTATTGLCTALYTACANYEDACDEACQRNPGILKCPLVEPYCGTFAFPGATYLLNCQTALALVQDVEFLNDFYITAIGSTLASEPTTNPFGFTASASLGDFSPDPTSTSGSFPTPSSYGSGGNYHSGLSQIAIDGIAAGAAIVGTIILAAIVFFCIRARRKREIEAAKRPPAYLQAMQQPAQQQPQPQQSQPPKAFGDYQSVPQQEQQQPIQQQVQQQPPQQPPKAFGGYQSVPQQEQQPQVTELPNSLPRTPELPNAHPQTQPPPQSALLSPSSSISALTHHSPPTPDPRLSSASTAVLSPVSPGPDQRQSYYIPPSPAIAEVDATMGNPSVPFNAAHGVPIEVDANAGNPGFPAGGYGTGNQMMPAETPSVAELDGRMNWAGGGAHS